jgi:tetratricopeptide (TPR) repeat protein
MLKEKELNNKKAITNITEYLTVIKRLEDGDLLFRGQADAKWLLRSGAARRIWGEGSKAKSNYSDIEVYIKELLETVKEKELEKHNQKYDLDCDLKILAQLQHYGAATPLLDFSNNSLVALWMACGDQPEEDGKVFIFNTDQEKIKRIKVKDLDKEIKFFDLITGVSNDENESPYHSCIWEPSHFNARIPAQSSIFFFAKEEYSIEVSSMIISSDDKKNILAELENMFGLKEENIFPDFAGFAQANGAVKAYQNKDENHYFKLTEKLLQVERLPEALEACNHAIEINKNVAKFFATRAFINNKLEKMEDALKDYNKAIELNSGYVLAYNNRGNIKQSLDRYEDALKDYDKAIELDSRYFIAYRNRGNAKDKLKQYEDAIKDYDKAIELNPRSFEAYCGRGNSKDKLKQHEEAMKDFNKAIELDPKNPLGYYNRGNGKTKLTQYEEAIKDYSKAIELDPKYSMAYCNRGVVFDNIGDNKKALKDYSQAIALDIKNAIAYNNRGLNIFKSGQNKEALKDYDKAIELDPNLTAAYFNRGILQHKLSNHKEALENYDMAIKLSPDCGFYDNRGCVKFELGDYKEAIEDCNKAIELNVEFASAYNNRGVVKTKLEQYKEAREDILKAKKLAEEQGDAELVKAVEESLQELDEAEKKAQAKAQKTK